MVAREDRKRAERLNLLAGLLIGIYGNWLFSYMDKIQFSDNLTVSYTQGGLILVSFACFLVFCVTVTLTTIRYDITFGIGLLHIFSLVASFPITGRQADPRFWADSFMGIALYMAIFTAVANRLDIIKKEN